MFKTINGFTKSKMIAIIKDKVKSVPCVDIKTEKCLYKNKSGNHCGIGAFIPANETAAFKSLLGKMSYSITSLPFGNICH